MNGAVTHLEIGASTGAKSPAFFEKLFGWSFNSMGEGNGFFNTPTCKAGLHPGDPSPGIVAYLSIEDIEVAVAHVRELGGQAGEISPNEPGFGRFCSCKDPEGVVFGLHQPSTTLP
jgi:uncharacterized protein